MKEETLLSLIYIAGYVQKKGGVVKENDSLFHYKFGKYIDALNRGSLSYSSTRLSRAVVYILRDFLSASFRCGMSKIFC